LYRDALRDAAEASGLPTRIVPPRDLETAAAVAMHVSPTELPALLVEVGRVVGKPWAKTKRLRRSLRDAALPSQFVIRPPTKFTRGKPLPLPSEHAVSSGPDINAREGLMKVALVTGASRGLGAVMAKALAADGWAVAVNYAHDAEGASKIVDEVMASGGKPSVPSSVSSTRARWRLASRRLGGALGPWT